MVVVVGHEILETAPSPKSLFSLWIWGWDFGAGTWTRACQLEISKSWTTLCNTSKSWKAQNQNAFTFSLKSVAQKSSIAPYSFYAFIYRAKSGFFWVYELLPFPCSRTPSLTCILDKWMVFGEWWYSLSFYFIERCVYFTWDWNLISRLFMQINFMSRCDNIIGEAPRTPTVHIGKEKLKSKHFFKNVIPLSLPS